MESKSNNVSPLSFLPVALDISLAFNKRLLTSPFRGSNGAPTYARDIFYASTRATFDSTSCEQGQYLLPSTDKIYLRHCKRAGQTPDTVPLEHGAQGHWIGRRDAKFVMLFIHGGGFIIPASHGHMKYQFLLRHTLNASFDPENDISIFSLHYTLAPTHPFPTQLSQAVSALTYLISTGRSPDSIIVAGDSAGGNLAAALLLHLARPKAGVQEVVLDGEGKGKLRGALLISPWVSFRVDGEAFVRNRERDYITLRALGRARNAYLKGISGGGRNDGRVRQGEGGLQEDLKEGGEKGDVYAEPILAEEEWWRDIGERVVGNVLVWGGGNEVFIDEIERFVGVVREGFKMGGRETENGDLDAGGTEVGGMEEIGVRERVEFVMVPEKAHEEMILEQMFFPKWRRHGAKEIENWLLDVL